MNIGYARVSTQKQDLQGQIKLLEEAGCKKIFTDVASGVHQNRQGLQSMLQQLRADDTVICVKNDRIFRSLKNMTELMDTFIKKGVFFKSLTEPAFDMTSSNGKLMIHIFSAIAEFERSLISERTKIGLDAARKRNAAIGRPKGFSKATLQKYQYADLLYKSTLRGIHDVCAQVGISTSAFYRVKGHLGQK